MEDCDENQRNQSAFILWLENLFRGDAMSTRFALSIPEHYWQDISDAPKDGSIIFVRDEQDEVDIVRWDNGEWSAEFGCCNILTHFAVLSIF
jgi:hypothetical protein